MKPINRFKPAGCDEGDWALAMNTPGQCLGCGIVTPEGGDECERCRVERIALEDSDDEC